MASYKELLKLLRAGWSPDEIRTRMGLPPSILLRMLHYKAFLREVEVDRQLAAASASVRREPQQTQALLE